MPICVGFGISQPEHARMLAPVADGLIVGSAIMRRIATASESNDRPSVLAGVTEFCKSMLAAIE